MPHLPFSQSSGNPHFRVSGMWSGSSPTLRHPSKYFFWSLVNSLSWSLNCSMWSHFGVHCSGSWGIIICSKFESPWVRGHTKERVRMLLVGPYGSSDSSVFTVWTPLSACPLLWGKWELPWWCDRYHRILQTQQIHGMNMGTIIADYFFQNPLMMLYSVVWWSQDISRNNHP